jgi:regulator of protease activity HflC (stomatin/prohibitin superfamily)
LIGDSNSKDGVRTETRDEIIRHVNLSDDVYVVQITDAEDKTSLPLDIQLMMKIRIVNPYLALFAIEKWMENVTTVAGSKYRKLVAGYKFEQIASEFTSLGDDWWTEFLWHIANARGEDLERRYGVRILVSEIWKVDPATAEGRDPEIFNAQRTIFIAEKGARKTVIEAEANRVKLERTGIGEGQQIAEKAKGEAEATRTKMAAEADRIKTVFETIGSFGEAGQKIKFMETLEEMGNKEGKTVVIPIGDMSRFLNGTLGIEQQSKLFNDLASKGITADMIAQAIRNLKNPPRGGRRGH